MQIGSRCVVVLVLASALIALTACGGLSAGNNNGGGGNGGGQGDIHAVNHVVVMLQENRSFDTYFGKLNDYLTANGFPQAGQVDGFSDTFSNPADNGQAITVFHLNTKCIENVSPDWSESHQDVNLQDPSADPPSPGSPMNGFVHTAAGIARFFGFTDTLGQRAMGYYTGDDLPYYYFMAANFATSDRWFSPIPTNTVPNRMYLLAATSVGHAHTPTATIDARTIFQALDEAGITWKVYVTDINPAVSPTAANALMLSSYMHYFNWSAGKLDHFVPLEPTYFNDVQNGTLPQVALIESGYFSGRDEHPNAGQHIQFGAKYVSGIINALIASPSWKDSVFIWTFDEGGGAFEHVPPQVAVAPDSIAPVDLSPNDPKLGFTRTGFRVPMFIVSPFAKKNFVSHTPMDYTAIDHFIEARFGLAPLTARDAAQPDMTEFFDFTNGGPWATPPAQTSIPVQQVLPPCTTSLP